jgi:hypothetical protein
MNNRKIGFEAGHFQWGVGPLLGSLLLALVAILPAMASKGIPSGAEHHSPKLVLASSPSFGFAPVTVQLVATLTGIDPSDPNYCHATVTWVRVDPGPSPQKETRLSESPRCVHGDHESSVSTTLDKAFDLEIPGSYLYRVSVTGKDGKEIRSNYVTVKVLRVQ